MPRAHNHPGSALLGLQLGKDGHPLPRHGPPAHPFPHDLKVPPDQLFRRPPEDPHARRVDGALVGDEGQRVRGGVEAGEVDAAVGQAGEDLGAVVGFGVGGEDGVAFLVAAAAARPVEGIRFVECGRRPVRRADDERVARQRRYGYLRLRVREQGAVDLRRPGAGREDEAGAGEGLRLLGGAVEDRDACEGARGGGGDGDWFGRVVEVDVGVGLAAFHEEAAEEEWVTVEWRRFSISSNR